MTSTQDVTGRQLPMVTVPAGELGYDWLYTMGPLLPRLIMAAQYREEDVNAGRCNSL